MKKLFILAMLFAAPAQAANVFTCEPEWAALVRELDPAAEVSSATTALQDPHYISAKPSLIAKARNADFIVCSGAQLEIGWLPLLLSKAGKNDNDVIYASQYVKLLDKPAKVDRSMGDVHPEGNPHIHLDPRNIPSVADAVAEKLGVDAGPFKSRWALAVKKWEASAKGLRGKKAITNHRNMEYLFVWLGMSEAGNLEPKPGVPPTAAHLAGLVKIEADMILYAPFENPDAAEWLSDKTGIPAKQVPFTGDNLYELFDKTLETLK